MMNSHAALAPAASVELLRHALATLAYRSAKALRDAPPGFADFRPCDTARTPLEILAHMGDLLDWAVSIATGTLVWKDSDPLPWPQECDRYFAGLAAVDQCLHPGHELKRRPERILQGPIADALTHTGQLTLLRRMFGSPVRGENYYVASIEAGSVGPDQPLPNMEFDKEPAPAATHSSI